MHGCEPDVEPPTVDMLEVIRHVWGWDALLPMQRQAIEAALDGRDSLLVLPTGGGKSLCYQVPPLVQRGLTIVVSPLIALMKDQVDGLVQVGVLAACLHADMDAQEQRRVHDALSSGEVRLLYVTPERLVMPGFIALLATLKPAWIAIDEAHCISQWGHDFRPEYRRIAEVRRALPGASMHAFTATATLRVREDIRRQLELVDPVELIGDIDRPNLTYRVTPRVDTNAQVFEALSRHRGEPGIVYCATRRQTQRVAESLREKGLHSVAYHAGLERDDRARIQDDFAAERVDIVVATVAFGMGIDRSDVRCIVHASMPDSLERYQQETGRAGRDGLPSECVMLFSGGDGARWRSMHDTRERFDLLEQMEAFCMRASCRRTLLAMHFGQASPPTPCGACDVCLGEVALLDDATTVARKILSAVVRTGQRYGVGYVVDVLRDTGHDQLRRRGHDTLSVVGILSSRTRASVTSLVWQLVHLRLLSRVGEDRPVLVLSEDGLEVLRGHREVALLAPPSRPVGPTARERASWAGVDAGLFDRLRRLRRSLAASQGVPAYLVFSDATLRDMAARKPGTPDEMLEIKGVGDRTLQRYGDAFLAVIGESG